MFPLTMRSESSMRQQKDIQKLAHIQQKYKDNPDMLNQSDSIVNSMEFSIGGCLPCCCKYRYFYLSRLLAHAIELYQAPMLWIPDLSSKDPWYIFPALVTIGMLSGAASVDDKQKMSVIAMALIFGALTASFSAGLALYITVNTFLGLLQTYLVKLFHKS
jgi:YidC/Oxa1 family membrane protein insertase